MSTSSCKLISHPRLQDSWVAGWVDGFPNHATGQVTFSLRLAFEDRPIEVLPRLRLTWYDPPVEIEAGVALRVLVRLKEPRGLSNPGGFDYERWLFSEGYGATGYVREGGLLQDAPVTLARWWVRARFDLARRIVAASPGADALDTIVVSHADTDHSGGAAAVIDSYPRALLVAGPDVALTDASVCQAGQSWIWDGVEFSFLHPPANFTLLGNDSSCVLKVRTDVGTLIITGDIESFGERALLSGVPDLQTDVVIVPHHGSATSSTPALVNSMNARYAVVSAAYSNQWDFPRPEVRARWEASGAEMVTTGDSGAITVVFGAAADPRLTARRDKRRRYWHTKPPGVSG